jgi:hypothetical protein
MGGPLAFSRRGVHAREYATRNVLRAINVRRPHTDFAGSDSMQKAQVRVVYIPKVLVGESAHVNTGCHWKVHQGKSHLPVSFRVVKTASCELTLLTAPCPYLLPEWMPRRYGHRV